VFTILAIQPISPTEINSQNRFRSNSRYATAYECQISLGQHFMRTARLWVLDLNICHIWEGTAAINNPESLIAHQVAEFFENYP
jgi:hypothetical protein